MHARALKARWRAWRLASSRVDPAPGWEALSGGQPVKVFINNRDRLTWTRRLAETVARDPRCAVVIVDNAYLPIHVAGHRPGTTVVQVWHAVGALKRFGVDTALPLAEPAPA